MSKFDKILLMCPICNSWDTQVYEDFIYCNDCNKEIKLDNKIIEKLMKLHAYETRIQLSFEVHEENKGLAYYKHFYNDIKNIHFE